MEHEAADPTTIVVYYDCCVPWNAVTNLLEPALGFAHHLSCRKLFPEQIYRNDPLLFGAVDEYHKINFPRQLCVFVTTDEGFKTQVVRHPAFGSSVIFIYWEAVGTSYETNWLWAKDVARRLLEAFMEMRYIKSRRLVSREDFCREAGLVLKKSFLLPAA
ncbi:MAG: hypothetical protein HYW89_02775 [Candidatus Sungiibacteriota bacterium]|uniref:Uncharacterized protein n=1 Tax=Candidatus Sungiibacteriota bacterium TaxID=2750080 RepID=A0A7T5UPJ7_9BACT|nr:MAG: hypothetical protein HYW89_02775 [Candidatus Sungbacteria bacterium]